MYTATQVLKNIADREIKPNFQSECKCMCILYSYTGKVEIFPPISVHNEHGASLNSSQVGSKHKSKKVKAIRK